MDSRSTLRRLSLLLPAILAAGFLAGSGERRDAFADIAVDPLASDGGIPDDGDFEADSEEQLRVLRGGGVRLSGSSPCDAGQKAFEKTVFPLIRTHCLFCHGGNGPGPGFAVPEAQDSYRRVLNYVNFEELKESRLAKVGGNYHCFTKFGFDCGVKTPEPILAALDGWKSGGQDACPSAGRVFTSDFAVPAGLPGRAQGFVPVVFDLSELGGKFKGASLRMEMQRFAEWTPDFKGAYRFRKPRLTLAQGASMAVKGIRVLVNGQWDPLADRYVSIDQVVGHAPFPVLSTGPLIVIQGKEAGDRISLSFETLEEAPSPLCGALDQFKLAVKPVLQARACYHCHGGGPAGSQGVQDALVALDLRGSDADACVRALERVSFAQPLGSAWIAYPFSGLFGHLRAIPAIGEVQPGWTDWIEAERLNQGVNHE
jgi:mono/diheme cytochrome c family protein